MPGAADAQPTTTKPRLEKTTVGKDSDFCLQQVLRHAGASKQLRQQFQGTVLGGASALRELNHNKRLPCGYSFWQWLPSTIAGRTSPIRPCARLAAGGIGRQRQAPSSHVAHSWVLVRSFAKVAASMQSHEEERRRLALDEVR